MDRDDDPDTGDDTRAVLAVDPVCGRTVERALAAGTEPYGGMTYFFCSASCKQTFRANPTHYATEGVQAPSHRGL